MLNLIKLNHFTVVADLGSFTRAAATLEVPQSVLSRHVRDVEQDLTVRLLHRNGRGVELTDAGRALLPKLRALLADSNAVIEDARRLQPAPSGIVRLGILSTLAPVVLPSLFEMATAQLPQIRLRVTVGLTHHLEQLLSTGKLDLAIMYDRRMAQATDEALLTVDSYLIGAARDGLMWPATIRFADVGGIPLCLPAPPNRLRAILNQAFRRNGVVANVITEVDGVATLKDLAASSDSFTILPLHYVAPDIAAKRLRAARIVDPCITRTVLLASAKQGRMDIACGEIAHLIRDQTPKLVAAATRNLRA